MKAAGGASLLRRFGLGFELVYTEFKGSDPILHTGHHESADPTADSEPEKAPTVPSKPLFFFHRIILSSKKQKPRRLSPDSRSGISHRSTTDGGVVASIVVLTGTSGTGSNTAGRVGIVAGTPRGSVRPDRFPWYGRRNRVPSVDIPGANRLRPERQTEPDNTRIEPRKPSSSLSPFLP